MPSDPFETFAANSPLAELGTDNQIDEFLSRINDDLVAGAPEKITDERLGKLVELYRKQAVDWVQAQADKPERKTGTRKKTIAEALNLDIQL